MSEIRKESPVAVSTATPTNDGTQNHLVGLEHDASKPAEAVRADEDQLSAFELSLGGVQYKGAVIFQPLVLTGKNRLLFHKMLILNHICR